MSEKLISGQPSSSVIQQTQNPWETVWLRLGAVVGTGTFVGISIATGVVESFVLLAIVLGTIIAACSELNRVQLVVNSVVQDETQGHSYSYLNSYLSPWLGFIAGYMFVMGGTAAAATAALGLSGYFLDLLELHEPVWIVPTAFVCVILLVVGALKGLNSFPSISRLITLVTLLSLFFFVGVGLKLDFSTKGVNLTQGFTLPPMGSIAAIALLFQATALMFNAFIDYRQIDYRQIDYGQTHPAQADPAQIAQSDGEPRPSPHGFARAILITLLLAMVLDLGVAIAAIGSVGPTVLANAAEANIAPLGVAAHQFGMAGSAEVLAIGAIGALLGVLMPLILKLAWVLVAMARQREVPGMLARLTQRQIPLVALLTVGSAIAGLVLFSNIITLWSFSAFGILIYYTITNLAALQLSPQERLYPRWLTWLNLAICLLLTFCIEWQIWLMGWGLMAIGLIWRGINQWAEEQSGRF